MAQSIVQFCHGPRRRTTHDFLRRVFTSLRESYGRSGLARSLKKKVVGGPAEFTLGQSEAASRGRTMTAGGVYVGAIALTATAHAAPFDIYRAACLDTGIDLARVRAQATAQKWAALTDAEREKLSPGNPTAVEGWAIVEGGARHLVSISGSTVEGGMTGDRSGSNVTSCGTLSPKSDDKAAANSYSAYLKRQPSEDRADGFVTYTWSVQDAANINYHYVVSGTNMPGLSLSVSTIRK